jgi:isopentenyl diphosphate isomerase/L-lactate dehydrogenase-like FMN-dependent dehydrogenase
MQPPYSLLKIKRRWVLQPFFYQLYVHPDRAICKEMVQKAEAAGCRVHSITAGLKRGSLPPSYDPL